MAQPYARVTIEEFDNETASVNTLTWYQVGSQQRPTIGEVAEALFEDHNVSLPREKGD